MKLLFFSEFDAKSEFSLSFMVKISRFSDKVLFLFKEKGSFVLEIIVFSSFSWKEALKSCELLSLGFSESDFR